MRRGPAHSLPYDLRQGCALQKLQHQWTGQPLIMQCCSLNVFLPEYLSHWPINKSPGIKMRMESQNQLLRFVYKTAENKV